MIILLDVDQKNVKDFASYEELKAWVNAPCECGNCRKDSVDLTNATAVSIKELRKAFKKASN